MNRYDVVVVGGGPAGASAAHDLAVAGVRTAVLERAALPRYKSCGGGVPLRTAALLPCAVDSVIEDSVADLLVSYRGKHQFRRCSGGPFAHMVMRDRFDALLLDSAAAAGADVIDRASVREIERDGPGFCLRTEQGSYQTRFVVGADGANSLVARATRLGGGMAEAAALEAEIEAPEAALGRWRARANVDLGYRPWGYGWVFPKQQRLSVGIVLPRSLGARLRCELHTYLAHLGLSRAPVERTVGHKLLFRRGNEPIVGDGVLLVGDAAGLVDEFTAEGIYYAVRSGQLAAQALASAIERDSSGLREFERAVDREIMPELRAARTVARLFYGSLTLAPAAMMLWSKHVGYVWDAFFRVQRGESTYEAEVRRARLVLPFARLVLR